ncbi:hypothetical protein [Spirosoma montaniterrae]|uniref:Alpha glucuronidase N-terminal domain-containing protein n=1 Tax=Spirosoma montaniterrae TaxID=1178516 RepID=A0A1P9WRK5_9BACT|nr:hypothetical protein [Spirosoma montaniterrae]AQG77991.1 hypothetical protein AWR27_00675 [Spirosoma montaniterrae]
MRFFLSLLLLLSVVGSGFAQTPLNLARAVVYCPTGATTPERKAAQMLVEEIQKRTRIRLAQATQWPTSNSPVIAVGQAVALKKTGRKAPPVQTPKDGFQVRVDAAPGQPIIWVQGNDPRGTVFGAGWLLRQLTLMRDTVLADNSLAISTAPQTPLRGHQLGYRATPNSYDGWDLAQWEQYIRDLVVFGANAIELIPPRSDTDRDSPHFPLPPMETMIGMSQLAADYGLDVWVWYPALDDDYSKPETVQFALNEWGNVLKQLPKLNAILVPCGDPGHTPPQLLVPMLEKQAAQLKKYHANVQWWMSPQGFDEKRLATFKALIEQNPPWLTGLAYGPWMRLSLPDFRKWTPARYPIRQYPDITHSHRCQYPVPDWDYAYVLTQHREPINPRPQDMAAIYRYSAPHTIGYITYSEGCNDDVNKAIWSALGWDPNQPVDQILREYSRYFIGPAVADRFASGLQRLEQNWRGSVRTNTGIDSTLALFQQVEQQAGPHLLQNWRFQQALFRAYYDAYVRQRVLHEQHLETDALAMLTNAPVLGSAGAMQRAVERLAEAETQPVALPLKMRVLELGEALFQTINMQLYMKRHAAVRSDGATLERLNTPLNNRSYVLQRFSSIATLTTENERLVQLRALQAELQPHENQPGVLYDDLGNPARQPHLVKADTYKNDPDFLKTPLTINEQRAPGSLRYPLSWYSHVMGLYDQPIRLHYDGLDPAARYKVRVVYASGPVRMVANQNTEIHPLQKKEFTLLEYDLPAETTRTGTLDLSWTGTPRAGESGRGNQVSEVWLIKQ